MKLSSTRPNYWKIIPLSLGVCFLINVLSFGLYSLTKANNNLQATDNELHGEIQSKGSVISELKLGDCYCKKFKDRLVIFHREYGSTVDDGQNRLLITIVKTDSVDFLFLPLGMVETIRYNFIEKKLKLSSDKQSVGQILKGDISLSGLGMDSDGNKQNIKIKGNFKCIVQDSSYKHGSASGFKNK